MPPKYRIHRPGKPSFDSRYENVREILEEPLDGRPIERLSHTAEAAELAIRKMVASGWDDVTIARHLHVRAPDRIARAREWLQVAPAAEAPRPSEAEQAADFGRFVGEGEPPEAA